MHNFDDEVLSFRSFSQALKDIDVDKLPLDYPEHLCEFGKFVRDEIIPKFGVLRSIETSYVVSVSEMLENYNPYALLRLISENPYTLNLPVVWDFNGIVDDGYARRDEFVCNLDDRKKFLVVTEGSSDASIVKHAFDVLKPYITDFFKFVDMEKGYPFSGTGNLFKFVQGLISIGVHNDIIVLLDNDAEGNATLQRCLNLDIPKNMRIIKLPDLGQFENFKTVGPNGISYADINGKAASIECYLDLHDDALVRWRSYNDSLDVYQGALISKDKYKKDFLDIKENDLNYNYEKITMVLHLILDTAKSMRESM